MMQRERILSCACELFLEHGLDGFSMRKLASMMGVTAPALYRHYDSREKILLEVVGEAFKIHAQYLYRALQAPTAEERLMTAGRAYLDFALDHPRYYEIFHASPAALGLKEFPEETVAQACAIGRFWNDRVRECIDAGILRPDDPDRVSLTMWGLAHGLVSLHHRGNLELGEEEFRKFYDESFCRAFVGIAADGYREGMLAEASAAAGRPAEPAAAGSAERGGDGVAAGSP